MGSYSDGTYGDRVYPCVRILTYAKPTVDTVTPTFKVRSRVAELCEFGTPFVGGGDGIRSREHLLLLHTHATLLSQTRKGSLVRVSGSGSDINRCVHRCFLHTRTKAYTRPAVVAYLRIREDGIISVAESERSLVQRRRSRNHSCKES